MCEGLICSHISKFSLQTIDYLRNILFYQSYFKFINDYDKYVQFKAILKK